MSHASFIGNEAGQMNGLGRIVFRESFSFATMTTGALLWVESHGTMPRTRELTVRL